MPEPIKGLQLANNVTELTAIAPLKPGGAEALRATFATKRQQEARGAPNPIEQIESIHYARWVILDGGTRLLFTSNFDGDLEDYLAEFAERDEGPLNGIFGYCEGWPGARPVGPFIQYVRDHMVPAEYYYSAYPRYTVKEVKRALYWKVKTEEVIDNLLPQLADLVVAIKQCCIDLPEAEKNLKSQKVDPTAFEALRADIREFLKKLAIPTPVDFGRNRP